MFSTLRIPQIFIALDLTSRTKSSGAFLAREGVYRSSFRNLFLVHEVPRSGFFGSSERGFQLGNARP